MHSQSKNVVLIPTVQVAAILSMRQHDIEPLIVVVKFKNEYDTTYVFQTRIFYKYLLFYNKMQIYKCKIKCNEKHT